MLVYLTTYSVIYMSIKKQSRNFVMRLYSIITQKTIILIFTALRTIDLTFLDYYHCPSLQLGCIFWSLLIVFEFCF
jgi:hypothetical protein